MNTEPQANKGETSADLVPPPSALATTLPPAEKKRVGDNAIMTGCAFGGGLLFNILNVATGGEVPGGFKGGMIGGFLGAVVAFGINAIRRK